MLLAAAVFILLVILVIGFGQWVIGASKSQLLEALKYFSIGMGAGAFVLIALFFLVQLF